MNREEPLEKIADSSDPLGIKESQRICSLSREERYREYRRVCDRIDNGRRAGDIRRRGAFSVKDAMAQVYGIHPNFGDISLALSAMALTAMVGTGVYLIGYQGIIKHLIEYFSK